MAGIRDNREPTHFEFPFQTVTGLSWGEIDGGDELLKKEKEKEDEADGLESNPRLRGDV